MKKILIVFLMFVPFVVSADTGLDLRNQMLDSEIERLTNERDTKYEALQKCEKSTKGFKIAGLTTLVATGVGVYGNIKLAQKLNGKSGGGGIVNANQDTRTIEQRSDALCSGLCVKHPEAKHCEKCS